MKWIIRIDKVIKLLSGYFQIVAITLLFFMMIITVTDVTGRYFLIPLKGAYELSSYLLALIVFLSLAYTQVEKEHIIVDFLFEKFPKIIQRLVDVIWYFITSVILFILFWKTIEYALRIKGSSTAELHIPTSAVLLVVALGVFLYALAALVDFIKSITKVVKIVDSRNS